MADQYEICSTDSAGTWHVTKETYDYVRSEVILFCATRCDELIDFTNIAGIQIALRVSYISEIVISTDESREANKAFNKSVAERNKTWDE